MYNKISDELNDLFMLKNLDVEDEAFNFEILFEKIFDDLNFVELKSLIVKEKELFECSAKFYHKNQSIDSFAMETENCLENFNIETYINLENFGICYQFFEINSSFVLKGEDFIKIRIKFKKQKDFIYYYPIRILQSDYDYEFSQYFRCYYFINDVKSFGMKSSLISSTRIGLSAELKIRKTSIEILSVPYMTYCKHFHCRYNYYNIKLDNDIFDYNKDSIFVIKNSRNKHLIYHAEPKSGFVDFISNIGGLFGLYFGLSFIDISHILKSITRKIKFYLQRLIY